MHEIVRQAHVFTRGMSKNVESEIEKGRYDITGPDGKIILPTFWEQLVQPGWQVTHSLWAPGDKKQENLIFKDVLGRRFTFPFNLVHDWKASESPFLLVDISSSILVYGARLTELHLTSISHNREWKT